MNFKKTELSAKLVQLILKKWAKGVISSEEAKSFSDINEFIQRAKSLGWRLNDRTAQDF